MFVLLLERREKDIFERGIQGEREKERELREHQSVT